ncbi:universal stress protein [Algihabitans sp.]|uniref:universal stress protein n=1 Tax=Algihabitans sp. TaxID=2821514 RepID=UPI003BA9BDE4
MTERHDTRLMALVDASVYARSLCDHAAWIAKRTDAAVEVLHVLGRRETAATPIDLSGNIALGARSALLEELSELDEQTARLARKRGQAILDDAQMILEKAGVTAVQARLKLGDLIETVIESEAQADLVMIGKRGEAANFAKLHLGSNLERIVRSCHKPVFVASRAFRPIERFLIAYDGGASSMKAVDHVARSRLFAGLQCRLLAVGAETAETRKGLEDAEALLKAGGYSVQADILPGQPETAISEAVEAEGIDLLVMGAYGHSRMRSLFIGSTTTAMLRLCKVPVMLFR